LGVAGLALMSDDTHDMGLMPLRIDGVAHGLTVYGETFVLIPIGFIPPLQGAVQIDGIDADKNIADDILTGEEVAALFTAAVETLPCLGAKALGPIRDGPGTPASHTGLPRRRWPAPYKGDDVVLGPGGDRGSHERNGVRIPSVGH